MKNEEINIIRRKATELGMIFSEENLEALDQFITNAKADGLWEKLDVLYAPPFMTKATATEPSKPLNLVQKIEPAPPRNKKRRRK